jgi:hypothetical protein
MKKLFSLLLLLTILSCEKEKVELTAEDYLCAKTWYREWAITGLRTSSAITFYKDGTGIFNGYSFYKDGSQFHDSSVHNWKLHEGGKYYTLDNSDRHLILKLDADSFIYQSEITKGTIFRWAHKQ